MKKGAQGNFSLVNFRIQEPHSGSSRTSGSVAGAAGATGGERGCLILFRARVGRYSEMFQLQKPVTFRSGVIAFIKIKLRSHKNTQSS